MKKIQYIYILLLILGIGVSSCKKFLERNPVGRVSRDVMLEDVQGAKVALTGAYKLMSTYYRNEFGMFGDVASDNVVNNLLPSNVTMLEAFNFSHTADDALFSSYRIWQNVLEALNNVNNILNATDDLKAKFPSQLAQIEAIEGQALVLRAICHMDLSKVFAQPYNYTSDASHPGIPVLTKTPAPGAAVPRATMKETYAQILADLNASLPYLSKYNNGSAQALISYQAALGLLSRVYLYQGDWGNAVRTANLVISDTKYRLATATEYKSVFVTEPSSTAATKVESIFFLSGTGIEKVGVKEIITVFSAPIVKNTTDGTYATLAQYPASAKLMNSFTSDDIRKTDLFKTGGAYTVSNKYSEGAFVKSQAYNIQVIRLSEVYLNRAEANWNLQKYNDAAEDLKVIAQRAHPNQTIAISYASPADLYQQIANERNRELCYEGHRFYDIVRRKENLQRGNDCNSTVCSLTYPNNKFVLPFNTRELQANPALKQNPGYN